MVNTLYVDILFATDFACDLFSLYITGRLCRLDPRRFRIIVSAAIGAAASTAVAILQPGVRLASFLGIPISFVMCLVSFGWSGFGSSLRRTAILWSSGCLLFGVVSLLSEFLSAAVPQKYKWIVSLSLAISFFLIIVVSRIVRTDYSKRSARTTVNINGRSATLGCLVDSGNILCDPISGDPVIVIAGGCAGKYFPTDEISFLTGQSDAVPDSLRNKLRIVPSRTVDGEKLLRAIKPDSLTVDGERRRALVAFDGVPAGTYGTYDGLVPSSLAPGGLKRLRKKDGEGRKQKVRKG